MRALDLTRKLVISACAAVLFFSAMAVVFSSNTATPGTTCIKTGERISGTNKICYYDCAGSEAAITVKSHQLCPPTITR